MSRQNRCYDNQPKVMTIVQIWSKLYFWHPTQHHNKGVNMVWIKQKQYRTCPC